MRVFFPIFLFFLVQGCALNTRGDYWIPVDGADGPPEEDHSTEVDAPADLVDLVPPDNPADIPADVDGGECILSSDCDDGYPCNGIETCSAARACVAGAVPADGTDCGASPRSICLAGACVQSRCGDCFTDRMGGESCDDCNADPADGCNACAESCSGSEDCDDGDPCNGNESCQDASGVCVNGSLLPDGTECGASPRRICIAGRCLGSVCGDGIVDTAGGEQCEGAWSQPCDTPCGSQGSRSCQDCSWTGCAVSAETCNGQDDDCDGQCDEGWTCCSGSTGTETYAHCTFTTRCDGACAGYVVNYGSPPANDTCAGALPLTCPGSVSGSTCSAVNDYTPSTACAGECDGSTHYARDVVYRVTVPPGEVWHLDLDTYGSELDSILYVRSGSCTGTELACNDDDGGDVNSYVRVTLNPGTTYVIVDSCNSDGIVNDLGAFTLHCSFF